MSIRKVTICSYAVDIVLFLCVTGTMDAQEHLVLGIHPYLPATELIDRFTPLAEYLSKKMGQPVILEIAKDYQIHIDNVVQ